MGEEVGDHRRPNWGCAPAKPREIPLTLNQSFTDRHQGNVGGTVGLSVIRNNPFPSQVERIRLQTAPRGDVTAR
ncbi:hypothetical protein NL676_013391 [Syzygium grande]|nr:hypothetical protein NL676_013391 [Syzygium grande]